MRFWGKWIVSLLLLSSSSAYAFTISLQSDEWYLLSIPGDANVVVSEMFDGQLDPAEKGDTWTILTFDSELQAYSDLSLSSELGPGEGFWFLHMSGSAVELDVDVFADTVPLSVAAPCQSPFGCYELPLPTGSGVRWSLLGTPFPEGVDVRDILIVTEVGACANGCTVQEAFDAELSGDKIYRYDVASSDYVALASDDLLVAGESYWFPTTITQSAGPAKIVIPTYCTPFT